MDIYNTSSPDKFQL